MGASSSSLADLHERLGRLIAEPSGVIPRLEPAAKRQFHVNDQHLRGLEVDVAVREPGYAMRSHIANARAEMGEERWQELQAEWAEGQSSNDQAERHSRRDEAERIRVRYGRGSPEYRRAALRAIL